MGDDRRQYAWAVPEFRMVTPFEPAGDQPKAIDELVAGVRRGDKFQTLL
jgi:excinuclease ABC subunit B